MTKSTKRSVLVSAVLAIVMCVSLIVGGTFAIFTSESKVNIAVTSGTVNVEATITDFSVYSPTSINMDEENTIKDSTNVATKLTVESGEKGQFYNGGTATLGTKNGIPTLTLDKMTPGDSVTATIKIENKSDVAIKYRTVIACTEDNELFEGLTVTIGGTTYEGISKKAKWSNLLAANAAIDSDTVEVVIELPTTAGNEYQGKSCTLSYIVEAVQGNAVTTDPVDGVIEISNAVELNLFRASINKNNSLYNRKTVKLTADIDLKNAEWTPIMMEGTNGNLITFDGQGHTISNFKVTADEGKRYSGLFGTANFSIIKNLNVDNATVKGYGHVSALVGHGMVTTIESCKVTNSILTASTWWDPKENSTGYWNDGDKVGAIIGWTDEGINSITGCTVEGCTVTGYRDIGGLVGHVGTTGGASQVVTGNTVNNTTVIQNLVNGYEATVPTTVKEIVGRMGGGFTLDTTSNTATDVKCVIS